LKKEHLIEIPLAPEEATTFYKHTNKLRSTLNKTKILRLIHGDVYCGERLKKFKMPEIDTCIRCFEKETKKHLMAKCPYTQDVWSLLGVNTNNIKAMLGTYLTREEFKIHADLLLSIVFRKSTLPPNTLIELTHLKYSEGVCRNNKLKEMAKVMIDNYKATGLWH
jgi:hypothetical protein